MKTETNEQEQRWLFKRALKEMRHYPDPNMSKEPHIRIGHKLGNLLLDLEVEFEDKRRIDAELFNLAGYPYHTGNYIDSEFGKIHIFYRLVTSPEDTLYLKGFIPLSTDSKATVTASLIPSIERVGVRNSIDKGFSHTSGMGFHAIETAMKRLEKFDSLPGFAKDGIKIPYDPAVLEKMIYQSLPRRLK